MSTSFHWTASVFLYTLSEHDSHELFGITSTNIKNAPIIFLTAGFYRKAPMFQQFCPKMCSHEPIGISSKKYKKYSLNPILELLVTKISDLYSNIWGQRIFSPTPPCIGIGCYFHAYRVIRV